MTPVRDLGPSGVRVNCIASSTALTDRLRESLPPAAQDQLTRTHPLRRLGSPADVAAATLYLASESAGWLTGVTLDIAGGR